MNTKRNLTRVIWVSVLGATAAGIAAGAVVLDQIGPADSYICGTSPTISEIFTDLPGYECMVVDDFTVGDSGLQLTCVSALFQAGGGFAGFNEVAGYQLSIFSISGYAANNLFGDAASQLVVVGAGATVTQVNGGDHGLVTLDVDISLPAAGTYWVGVAPVAADYLAGRFYLQNNGAQAPATPGNANGMFANPNDGFGIGGLSPINVDYAYAITVVPEPAAAMLWLLGGIAWCRRRRRRRQPAGTC